MQRTGRKKEWSILVFCLFLIGICPPALFVFDKEIIIAGMPLSFLYLYGLWALMIVFIAIGARRRKLPPSLEELRKQKQRLEEDALTRSANV